MSSQTFQLPAPAYAYISVGLYSANWTGLSLAVDAALLPAGAAAATIDGVAIDGISNPSEIYLSLAGGDRDLSGAFETGGSLTFRNGEHSWTLETGGRDTSEPYRWSIPAGDAENALAAFVQTFNGQTTGMTLTIDDGVVADVAPTLPAVADRTGVVGTDVDVTLPAATAGSPAPTYSATGLPRGLMFDADSRRITGTPTHAETVTVTYQATNSEGTAQQQFTFTVNQAPALPTVDNQTGVVGTDVNVLLPAATAGTPAPTYSASGLPRGLAFSPSTRRITGRPTHAETVTVTYEATNSAGTATRTFTFTVAGAPEAPTLPVVAARTGVVGTDVDVTLPAATAGIPSPTYAATGLPDGLAFDADTRRITGRPTRVETATVTYTATNSEGTAQRQFTFTVNQAPTLPTVDNQTGVVGTDVDVLLPAATAGTPAPTYSASGLPRGLAFSPSTRRITGRPTHAETVTVTYEATNSAGTARRTFTFAIDPAPAAPVLPTVRDRSGTVGTPVNTQLSAASAGHPTPTYSVSGLPGGLAFNPNNRRITGTPNAAGTFEVTYTATNSEGSAERTFDFVIALAPVAPVLPDLPDRYGSVGIAVDLELPAASGHPAPTYSASGLPDGLAFAAATRRVTGVPTTVGAVTVTYEATNSQGTDSGTFEFVIETTGPRYKRAQRALAPTDVVLTALEVTHPDVSDPVRVVNDTVNRTIEGNTFTALRFQPRLVDDVESRLPRAEISIDNVGRALTQWIERSGGGAGAQCRVLQVVAGEDVPQYDVTLGVQSIPVSNAEVRVVLGHDDLFGRRAVRRRHDPQTSPGLF